MLNCFCYLVVAVALFGDPTHVPNVPYDRGTSKEDGVSDNPRRL